MDSQTPTTSVALTGWFWSRPRERVEIEGGEPSLTAELRAFANACKLHAQDAPFDILASSPQVKSVSLECVWLVRIAGNQRMMTDDSSESFSQHHGD